MIIYVWSGLTSRCVTLAEVYYLLKVWGGGQRCEKLTLIWPIDNECGIHFREVFSEDMFSDIEYKVVEVNFISKKYYDCSKSDGIRLNIKKMHFGKAIHAAILIFMDMIQEVKKKLLYIFFKDMIAVIFGKHYFEYTPSAEVDGVYTKNTWKQVNKALLRNEQIYIKAYNGIIMNENKENVDFSVIQFKEEYWKKVERIIIPEKRYIGIHIRRTDHKTAIDASSTQAFIHKINKIVNQEDIDFFLATDDVREEETLRQMYGNKLVVQENKEWGRTNSNEMKSGIIDCLCLSRCEYILGSYTSVFSFFAAKYGNKELIICRDVNSV